MKKKILSIFTATLLSISFLAGCSNQKPVSKNEKPTSTAVASEPSFVDVKKDFKGVQDISDTIVVGKVTRSYSYKLNNVIFTSYVVDLERQIKHKDKELPSQIEVIFTGGKLANESQPFFEEVKLPEIGQSYLFALAKLWPDKPEDIKYRLIGGDRQGMFKVELDEKQNITKVLNFNDKNEIEKEVIGKNMEELLRK